MGLVALSVLGDLPEPRIKPMSLALAGGFLATGPPGKSKIWIFFKELLM